MDSKILQEVDELKKQGIIKDYAICGAFATLFYTEPFNTSDLDILYVPKKEEFIISLSPIYNWLKGRGYKEKEEHIIIENMPVQFLPVYDELMEEAFETAQFKVYEGVQVKVLLPEYLIAICLRTGRLKDKMRVEFMLRQIDINKGLLDCLLCKYRLKL